MGSRPTKLVYLLALILGAIGILSVFISSLVPIVSWANFVPGMSGSFLFTAVAFVLLWLGVTFKGI